MEKELGREYPQEKRISYLSDNCDEIVDFTYMKPFEPEVVVEKKEKLAEISILLSEIEQEKKGILEGFRAQEKPLKDQKSVILAEIKNKAELVKEKVYKFVDQESRQVGFYNSDGLLVSQRPAFAGELQTTIFQVQKAATT